MTAQSLAYRRDLYGPILDWDRHSFKIRGRRVLLAGGEFHYWRMPDWQRWREILIRYRMGGLNCVRIYFHWGFHSPRRGVYRFDGPRDVAALLRICQELGLYVLAAPGPYICAETSGGGFPGWLLADRAVRLRHLKSHLRVSYDEAYAAACRQWFEALLPQIREFQITENSSGNLIALQIENELIQRKFIDLGLNPYMLDLMRTARQCGITAPLFHNDPWIEGSWAHPGEDRASVDLYSFDRYIIWHPRTTKPGQAARWKESDFDRAVRKEEKQLRSSGTVAANSPFFIAELQGGWFNQWGHGHGFDQIYDYYGEDYQKTLVESMLAQGMSAFSIYMYYGGTNWGTLGDPDVYSSYDYSAAIRENGYLSGRMHQLRKAILFARSFVDELCTSESFFSKAEASEMLAGARRSPAGVEFYFLRNFSNGRRSHFELRLGSMRSSGGLPPRQSFVAVAGLALGSARLLLCTMPWLARFPSAGEESWFLEWNNGELIFDQEPKETKGALRVKSEIIGSTRFWRVNFSGLGECRLRVGDRRLRLMIFSAREARSFGAEPEQGLAWQGPRGAAYLPGGALEVEAHHDCELHSYRQSRWSSSRLRGPSGPALPLHLRHVELARVDLEADLPWRSIKFPEDRNPMEHGFHSGHVCYALRFEAKDHASVRLNVRHRVWLWINHRSPGGHITYSDRAGRPGAKNGPDPAMFGGRRYDLSDALQPGVNTLYILTESLGYNRGPFGINDFRNARGLLAASLRGGREIDWRVYGRTQGEDKSPWNFSALPGEELARVANGLRWEKSREWPQLRPDDGIIWLRARFKLRRPRGLVEPLLAIVSGPQVLHLYVNDVYIGRYWSDFGPQSRFYIPDGLLRHGDNELLAGGYALKNGALDLELRPWVIDPESGNLKAQGQVYRALRSRIAFKV
ncbi:MAG: beta-galactosidase [Leptospirales bacterium]|nr:beta-galactosidase [Leptospirales bacterium]